MPGIKTEVTEIATGLGALGHDLGAALHDPPIQVVNVDQTTWARLAAAYDAGEHLDLFTASWLNGRAFLLAGDGLRGRIPVRVEWKGPDRQVGNEPIPADLRIDHVFLVSIKTRSAVLRNASPANVFIGRRGTGNWYLEIAPAEYQQLYAEARRHGGLFELPEDAADLTRALGQTLANQLPPRAWPVELQPQYRELARATAIESARLWNAALPGPADRESMGWWLIRLAPAPYYLLGATPRSALRVRVDPPWDWRQAWKFIDLEITPALDAGQPQVNWVLNARNLHSDELRTATGFVEIRWSHGKFCGAPEAKVQLRSPHEDVPGYVPLT